MEEEFLKRLFTAGEEPLVDHINNSCRVKLLRKIKEAVPQEYGKAMENPVFAPIIAIEENFLGYSGKLIYTMLSRQLVTKKKHEIWFVFGGRPLRFSLQEFHAVTGLNCDGDSGISNVAKMKKDTGFWGTLLKDKRSINIKSIITEVLPHVKGWKWLDKIRLVYVGVIAIMLMGFDEKKYIPHMYIKLVMDFEKLNNYPWGRVSFEHLVGCIFKVQEKLTNPQSYLLDGFSFAFQIWAMEAIPAIGKLLGKKIDDRVVASRCSNWTGCEKASYDEIIGLEKTLKNTDVVYPYISYKGNLDIYDLADFAWPDELGDARVDKLNAAIRSGTDFRGYLWETYKSEDDVVYESSCDAVDESYEAGEEADDDVQDDITVSDLKRKKRISDHGAEKRKRQVLNERATGIHGAMDEETKSFIGGLFTVGFSNLEKQLKETIDERLGKLESEFIELKNSLCREGFTHQGATTRAGVKNTYGVNSNVSLSLDDVYLSQFSNIYQNLGTQEYLNKTVGHLSQDTIVSGFDLNKTETMTEWSTKREELNVSPTQTYKAKSFNNIKNTNIDDALVFLSDESFDNMLEWSKTGKELKFGPSVLDNKSLTRIIGPCEWFQNEDMDVIMYLFRENTSLGRFESDRVAFMNCIFSMQITAVYQKFKKNRRGFKWDDFYLAYGNGYLPSHGKTGKRWALDVDRLYTPVFINGNHWISLCINFIHRTIEVFDCSHNNNTKHVQPFRDIIPHIVKAVQSPTIGKTLSVAEYAVLNIPLQRGLNKSSCDCGAYALKFIECHLHGWDFSLITDENIKEARMKIANDLWKAAMDPIFIERMSKYEPTKFDSDVVDIE